MYNHAFDIAFEVIDKQKDWRKIPASKILAALKIRVAELEIDSSMILECTSSFDSFEIASKEEES